MWPCPPPLAFAIRHFSARAATLRSVLPLLATLQRAAARGIAQAFLPTGVPVIAFILTLDAAFVTRVTLFSLAHGHATLKLRRHLGPRR